MVVEGKTYKIPLMTGSGGKSTKVSTIQGTKKTEKIIRKHKDHIWRGQIWQQDADEEEQERRTADRRQQSSEARHPMHRVSMHDSEWSHRHVTEAELHRLNRTVGADLKLTETEVQAAMAFAAAQIPHDESQQSLDKGKEKTETASTVKSTALNDQERDALAGLQGVDDFHPWKKAGSVHSQTNSSSSDRLKASTARNRAREEKISAEKELMTATSERIRARIMEEFPCKRFVGTEVFVGNQETIQQFP
jgi:hypothetical protein